MVAFPDGLTLQVLDHLVQQAWEILSISCSQLHIPEYSFRYTLFPVIQGAPEGCYYDGI